MNTATLAVLDRLLEPVAGCLTPEVARALVDLHADEETQTRIEELADKSTEGTLSSVEREEYEAYVSTIDFVTVLQSKARALLTRAPAA